MKIIPKDAFFVTDRLRLQTQCGLLVYRFPAVDRRRRLTSTQPSQSSRSGSPWSLSRLLWTVPVVLCFSAWVKALLLTATARLSQVTGSSRQDLPAAVRCLLTGTPLVFFHSTAEAVISVRLQFVTSHSLPCVFLLCLPLSFRGLFQSLHPVLTACKRSICALLWDHSASLGYKAEWALTPCTGGGRCCVQRQMEMGIRLSQNIRFKYLHLVFFKSSYSVTHSNQSIPVYP